RARETVETCTPARAATAARVTGGGGVVRGREGTERFYLMVREGSVGHGSREKRIVDRVLSAHKRLRTVCAIVCDTMSRTRRSILARTRLIATGGTIASRRSPQGLLSGAQGAELLAAAGLDGAGVEVEDIGSRGSY